MKVLNPSFFSVLIGFPVDILFSLKDWLQNLHMKINQKYKENNRTGKQKTSFII